MRAGFLYRQSILHYQICLLCGPSLSLVPTELTGALRRKPYVPHHNDPGIYNCLDHARDPLSSLQFDGVAAGFLQETPCVLDSLFDSALVAHERHVADRTCWAPRA